MEQSVGIKQQAREVENCCFDFSYYFCSDSRAFNWIYSLAAVFKVVSELL